MVETRSEGKASRPVPETVQFATLVDGMALGVVYQNAAGAIIYANPAAEEILGLSLDEMQGRTSLDARWRAIHEDGTDFPGDSHPAMASLRTGEPVEQVIMGVFHPRKEQYRWILVNARPEFRPGEALPYQVFATFQDITEWVNSEKFLRSSEQSTSAILNASLDSILLIDPEGQILRANNECARGYGLAPSEMTGKNIYQYHSEEVSRQRRPKVEECVHQRKPVNFEDTREGRRYQHSLYPVTGRQGNVSAVAIYSRDITEAHRASEGLRKSEENTRAILDATLDTILLIELDGKVLLANEQGARRLRTSVEDLIGKNVYDLLPPETGRSRKGKIQQVVKERSPVNFEDERNGIWFLNHIYPLFDPDGHIRRVAIYGRDITESKLGAKAIQESIDRLNQAQKIAHVGSWELDIPSRVLVWSDEIYRIYGLDPQEFIATYEAFLDVVHPEDREAVNQAYTASLIDRKPYEIVHRLLLKDGTIRYVREMCETTFDEGGTPLRSIGSVQDITRQVYFEQLLREEKEKIERIAATVPGGIFTYSFQSKGLSGLTYASPRVSELFGLAPEALSGSLVSVYENIFPGDAKRLNAALLESARELKPLQVEFRYKHPDRGDMWLEINAAPLPETDGERLFHGYIADISARKDAEAGLRLANERFEHLVQNIEDVFWVTDQVQHRAAYVSPAYETIWGRSLDRLMNTPELLMDDVLSDYHALVNEATRAEEEGRPTEIEYQIRRGDGTTRWIWERSSPVFDENGALIWTVGVSSDITDKKLAEMKLKESESFLLSIVKSAPGDILVVDPQGYYLYTNLHWDNQTDEAFRQTRFIDLVHPDLAVRAEELLQKTIQTKTIQSLEAPVLTRSGAHRWWQINFSPVIVDGEIERVTLFTFDIQERKQAEIALAASEEKYRLLAAELEQRVKERTVEVQDLYDNAPTGYHSEDASGAFRLINQTELNWLGYSRDEMIGKLKITDILTPESLRKYTDSFEQFIAQGGMKDFEIDLVRKNGSILPVIANSIAVFDPAGRYLSSRVTISDNTERKQAQEALRESERSLRSSRDALSAANAALEKASRLKDEFMASMSHELRTPLTGVLGLAEALQLETYGAVNEKQRNALVLIENSGRHLLELINDVLDLSKIEADMLELRFEEISVTEICQVSLQIIKGMAHQKQLSVSFTADPAYTTIQADARRLKQMLVNLLSNAVKFTLEGGSIGLAVAASEENQKIDLTVWDTGIGIKPEDMNRLFKPFVQLDSSLSRHHSGTGLGLSLVSRLAELHGGSVSVQSTPGKGSRFSISLPWAGLEQSAPTGEKGEMIYIRRCLLIEDNDLHRKQIGNYLQRLGIEMFFHEQGGGALEAAIKNRPDAILLDLNLPDIPGAEVLRELKHDPRTAQIVVIISSVEEDRKKYLGMGAAGYLVKPFSIDDLKIELAKVSAPAGKQEILPVSQPARQTILFADDNEVIVETFSDFLRAKAYNIIPARNGKELVDLAQAVRPDIILSDIQMPGMDGLQAIRLIRALGDPWFTQVPIVAITALAMPGDEEKCLEAGANQYISKPVPLGKLLGMIIDLLQTPKQ